MTPHRFTKKPEATQRARRLRRDMTTAEQRLWEKLRNAQLEGASFRKQHPIGNYIADLCAPSLKLVIELDGGQHNDEAGIAKDTQRTAQLNALGYRVVRFWNNDVLENTDGVLQEIARVIAEQKSIFSSP